MRNASLWRWVVLFGLLGLTTLAPAATPTLKPGSALPRDGLTTTTRLDAARMRQLSPQFGRLLAEGLARLPPAATLSIWDGGDAPPSDFFRTVPGPVTADRERKRLDWYFRYETALKPAKAMYQVSLFPFAAQSGDPRAAPGLVAQGPIGNVPTQGGRALFSIDFAPILRGRPWAELRPTVTPTRSITDKVTGAGESADPPGDSRRPGALRSPGSPRIDADGPRLSPARVPIVHSRYYIRVLLQRADGSLLGTPSSAVQLDFRALPPAEQIELVMGSHPKVRYADYRPVQADDWAQLCIREYLGAPVQGIGVDLLQPGQIVDACADHDEGFFERLGNALGDFFGALGGLVDSVSRAYAWAKSQAVALAASALEGLGVPCPCPIGSCEVCLSAALDYGLASLGIPPTLPNFDQLVDQGVDYLAASIAAETGLPAAEAMAVARKLAESGKEAPASANTLWRPLPQHLYAPPVLTVEAGPSEWPVTLVIDDPGGRYQQALVPLPALPQRIRVPVALQPVEDPGAWRQQIPTAVSLKGNLFDGANWMQDWITQMEGAAAELERWRQRYRSGPLRLQVATLSAAGSGWTRQEQLTLDCSADAVRCRIGP